MWEGRGNGQTGACVLGGHASFSLRDPSRVSICTVRRAACTIVKKEEIDALIWLGGATVPVVWTPCVPGGLLVLTMASPFRRATYARTPCHWAHLSFCVFFCLAGRGRGGGGGHTLPPTTTSLPKGLPGRRSGGSGRRDEPLLGRSQEEWSSCQAGASKSVKRLPWVWL